MSTQNGDFRELLKDILVQKEDLESHFQTALEVAKNKEDLTKLSTTVKKMEKILEELKNDIEKRIATFVIHTKANGPSVNGVPEAEVVDPQSAKKIPLNDSAQIPPEVTSTSMPTSPTGRSEDTKPTGSKVFHNQPSMDFSKFRKNPNIPDTQRIFLPILSSTTTEETLYKFFSNLGHQVVDVKVFTFPNGKNTSGAVGFSSADAVKQILQQKFIIEDYNVQPRQYYTKEEAYNYSYRNRAIINSGRYQIFCGGIPVRATLNDVKTVLGQYGKIRDIRIPTVKESHGTTLHRGFAFVDFESAQAAQALCDKHCIMILGKEVEVKPNTKPLGAILAEPSLSDLTSGPMMDLAATLPNVPFSSTQANKINQNSSGDRQVLGNNLGKEESCIICKKNPQNCALLWCGHTETCMECGAKLKNCPKQGCGAVVERRADVTPH